MKRIVKTMLVVILTLLTFASYLEYKAPVKSDTFPTVLIICYLCGLVIILRAAHKVSQDNRKYEPPKLSKRFNAVVLVSIMDSEMHEIHNFPYCLEIIYPVGEMEDHLTEMIGPDWRMQYRIDVPHANIVSPATFRTVSARN